MTVARGQQETRSRNREFNFPLREKQASKMPFEPREPSTAVVTVLTTVASVSFEAH